MISSVKLQRHPVVAEGSLIPELSYSKELSSEIGRIPTDPDSGLLRNRLATLPAANQWYPRCHLQTARGKGELKIGT
jgi:hypothetical protein